MLRLLKRYKTPLSVLLAVLLPLIVYRAGARAPGEANPLDKIVLLITTPVRQLMSWATGLTSDAWYGYVDVVDARTENALLRRRLWEAELERDRLMTLKIENEHLTALLDVKDRNPKMRFLPARVVGAGISPTSRTFEIDQGGLHGVERGMPVISGMGLVGLIQRVAWTTSEVLLIADEKVTCRARVVRTRAQGRVRGLGLRPGYRLQLLEVLRFDDITVGDRIVTSGLGGVFPAGMPIGEVAAVRTETKPVHRRIADVLPYADFARLERVSVILSWREAVDEIVTPEPMLPRALRSKSSTKAAP